MYPFSLLHIIQAANLGTQQDYFTNFDLSSYPEFFYTRTAHAEIPNSGVLNYFNNTDGGRANCTNAAVVVGPTPQDAAQMNLWSCALFPNLTRDFRDSILSNDSRAILLENEVDTNRSTSSHVTTFIATCLAAWCDNSEVCGKSVCRADQTTLYNNTLLSALGIDTCLDSICGVKRFSSPDIAGVGVITSIFIQITIACAAPLALLACRIVLIGLSSHRGTLIEKDLTEHQQLRIKTHSIQTLQESLIITLDEFQRAQCCFAIAIDIASLITMYTGSRTVTRIDRTAITLASFAGTLPTVVVFATLLLHKVQDLTYTIWLTSFTWILSLITGYLPLTRDLREMKYNYIAAQPAACGYQLPAHVCKEWGVESTVEKFSWVASMLSAVTMAFLAMKYVLPYTPAMIPNSLRTWLSANFPKPVHIRFGSWMPGKLRPWEMREALRAFMYLALFISMVNCLVYVVMILAYIDRGSMHREWSFGQVVAVSVWLPSILSFVNDCVYGLIQGRSNSLPRTLRLVRTVE
jgi:hypothetical protein